MDKFLRELDASIAKLSPAERQEAIDGLRRFLASLPALTFLKGISKFSVLRVLGDVMIAMQTGTEPAAWFEKMKARADKVGPNVTALFHSL